MKKKPKKKYNSFCRKCGDKERCHFCGRYKDNRGWAYTWKNNKNGPEHCICPSCRE